jgi:hypothetical protein
MSLTADNGVGLLLFRSDHMNRGGIEIDSTSLGSTSMDYRYNKWVLLEDCYLRENSMNSLQIVVPTVVLFLRNKLF